MQAGAYAPFLRMRRDACRTDCGEFLSAFAEGVVPLHGQGRIFPSWKEKRIDAALKGSLNMQPCPDGDFHEQVGLDVRGKSEGGGFHRTRGELHKAWVIFAGSQMLLKFHCHFCSPRPIR